MALPFLTKPQGQQLNTKINSLTQRAEELENGSSSSNSSESIFIINGEDIVLEPFYSGSNNYNVTGIDLEALVTALTNGSIIEMVNAKNILSIHFNELDSTYLTSSNVTYGNTGWENLCLFPYYRVAFLEYPPAYAFVLGKQDGEWVLTYRYID